MKNNRMPQKMGKWADIKCSFREKGTDHAKIRSESIREFLTLIMNENNSDIFVAIRRMIDIANKIESNQTNTMSSYKALLKYAEKLEGTMKEGCDKTRGPISTHWMNNNKKLPSDIISEYIIPSFRREIYLNESLQGKLDKIEVELVGN